VPDEETPDVGAPDAEDPDPDPDASTLPLEPPLPELEPTPLEPFEPLDVPFEGVELELLEQPRRTMASEAKLVLVDAILVSAKRMVSFLFVEHQATSAR
jgi:hypothetical protein